MIGHHKFNNSSPKHISTTFVVIIFSGIAIMLLSLYLSAVNGLNEAKKTMGRHIGDLKKQCSDYNDFLAADKVKSLVRLTEQAEDIGDTLALLPDNEKNKFLNSFLDSQRLDCILILDENLEPDGQFVKGRMDFQEWEDLISSPAISTVLNYPKDVYSARINHEGLTYDIAAATRDDKKGIIFCAVQQESEKLKSHYSPVQNLLVSNETALGGTMCITSGETIIASNYEHSKTSVSEIPEIAALASKKNGNELTRFYCDGAAYYGGKAKCLNYDIYVFYPSKEIFSGCRSTLLVVFCICVIAAAWILSFYYRTMAKHDREMNRQYEIIRSISHIYLFTVIVDMRDNRYTILKYPAKWGELSTSGMADKSFVDWIISFVGKEFREGYRAFVDPETIRHRLGSVDYVEFDYQDISGEWLNDKIIPQERDENGEFHSYILARTSIQEQKKAELENQQKLKTAAQNEALANQSKTDLLRRMSHDIRTPINVILGMLEIADRNPENKELLQSCRKKGRTAAEYLLELVNDVLTINKTEAGTPEAESTAPFDLADEVQKLYSVAEDQAKTLGVSLEPPKLEGENKPLVGNALYLRQIMMNIITNAVRYSHKGGTVQFFVSQMPDPEKDGYANVRFVCVDHGVGMSPEFQKKMFEPFAQEVDSDVSRFGGVGLGLSIVQSLVQKLGGQIYVDSKKDLGTRFDIVVPYRYACDPLEKKTAEREELSLDGLTVLLVEDNELNMEIAEYMLTDAGAKVIRAYDGIEAVNRFAYSTIGSIDAILTDMTMPGMDGLEEARRIRALDRSDAKTVPIIAVTANLFQQDMSACSNAGMTGFLSKPLNVEQLLTMISQQTRKGEQSHE